MSKNSSKSRKKKTKHVNSASVNDLVADIRSLESRVRGAGLVVTYPDTEHDKTPMLGHTKGNTASNRKVIKRHQQKELMKVKLHLEGILASAGVHTGDCGDLSDEDDGDSDIDQNFADYYEDF